MSSLQGKPLEAITEQDLQQLVTQSEQESQALDYKRESYKRNDEETREMLRDISAMANAFGGDILIGIDEDNDGAASNIIGIENPDEESQRMVSSCLSNIAERIGGLRIHPVTLQNGRFVLVVRIPRSLRAPHMVTFKGLNQFWIRHDRQKSPMSIYEVKDTCLKAEGLMERLTNFLADRRRNILEDVSYVPHYVISVTPLFMSNEIVDIRDSALHKLLDSPPSFSSRWTLWGDSTKYTLHGLRTQCEDFLSVDLFRNGHVALILKADEPPFLWKVNPRALQSTQHFNSFALSECTFLFLRVVSAIFTHIGMTDPVVISLSFYNIKGYGAPHNGSHFSLRGHQQIWQRDHLEIPPMQFVSLAFSDEENTKKIVKECLDRVWQAFGYEGVPNLEW